VKPPPTDAVLFGAMMLGMLAVVIAIVGALRW